MSSKVALINGNLLHGLGNLMFGNLLFGLVTVKLSYWLVP